MSKAPSVLLLDDGELERVRRLLERAGTDFTHLSGDQIGETIPEPTDLLITTGKRALAMPRSDSLVEPDRKPIWICIHGHDVSSLREELRNLGVHYLVHSALDQNSLNLLIEQVLYKQADRRCAARLPLGVEVTYRIGNELDKGKLAELSLQGCRILTPDRLYKDTELSLYLPRDLSLQRKIGLSGRVSRSAPYEPQPGVEWYSSVIIFEDLEPDAETVLERIFSGELASTRVTPLGSTQGCETLELVDVERRQHPRRLYKRRMALLAAIGVDAPQVLLGCDLSLNGLRIAPDDDLRPGMQIAIALYGDARSEPIIVQAEVRSDYAEKGLGLAFHTMTPQAHDRLEALLEDLPPLEQVTDDPDDRQIVVSEILETHSELPQD